MKLLVLQHTPWENPGRLLVNAAKKFKVSLNTVKVWKEPFPPLNNFDGVVVLGGTPNVGEEKKYPFLVDEKNFIRAVLDSDKPYIGFCLGHQLLADVLGERVSQNFCASIGIIDGFLTVAGKEHPIFAHMPKTQPLFKWHNQAVLPPIGENMEVLMTSSECQVEAMAVKDRPHVVGVQFDNHAASILDVTHWLEKDWKWVSSLQGPDIQADIILKKLKRSIGMMEECFDRFFENYISIIKNKTH